MSLVSRDLGPTFNPLIMVQKIIYLLLLFCIWQFNQRHHSVLSRDSHFYPSLCGSLYIIYIVFNFGNNN